MTSTKAALTTDNPKRNHHIIPRLYLKGFVEKQGEPFIWVYKKGQPYNPGSHKVRSNPYLDSIRHAGAQKDYYADPQDGGGKDYETYENMLESFEKPANPVFEKIRKQQIISGEEKAIFAFYIVQMLKRVPNHRERVKASLPKTIAAIEPSKELLQKLNWHDTPETRAFVKQVAERESKREGFDVNMYLRSIAYAPGSVIIDVLRNMTWRFLVAPTGNAFLTGDNPVFFFEGLGLNKRGSEISFPISTDITLVASWHNEHQERRFLEATSQIVKELNRKSASKASQYLYFSRSEKWVADLLSKSTHKFNLIF